MSDQNCVTWGSDGTTGRGDPVREEIDDWGRREAAGNVAFYRRRVAELDQRAGEPSPDGAVDVAAIYDPDHSGDGRLHVLRIAMRRHRRRRTHRVEVTAWTHRVGAPPPAPSKAAPAASRIAGAPE